MAISGIFLRLRNRYRRTLSVRYGRREVQLHPPQAIVSFTFDDFPDSALTEAGAILRRHGLHGTYYVSLGLMGRQIPAGQGFSAAELRQAIAEGHDLGCHTFAHCHSWNTRPVDFESSIVENQRALERLEPGARFRSLSYPISEPRPQTKLLAGKYFPCCRGGGPSFNLGASDATNLQATFIEKHREQPQAIKKLIDQTCLAKGWLILATHDVCHNPSPFGCAPALFEDIVKYAVSTGAGVLPVARAWELANSRTPP